MKNLKLVYSKILPTRNNVDGFCIDDENETYFSVGDDVYCSKDLMGNARQNNHRINHNVISEKRTKIDMVYLASTRNIFQAYSNGELFLYDIDRKELNSVGVLEAELKSFAWSPDELSLVLITDSNLILMSQDFDPITEKNLFSDEIGESTQVNVGWGSKSTQFHGSEGKHAAKTSSVLPKSTLESDTKSSSISWRNDSEYFVTSSVNPNKGFRELRIWNREAVLQCTCEALSGLEEHISWRPFGNNLITCSQQCPDKHKIIFFEKNGLQHGEFALPFRPNTHKVIHISWSPCGNILLVTVEISLDYPTRVLSLVLFYTCSNQHWYLKQTIKVDRSKMSFLKWHPFETFVLHFHLKRQPHISEVRFEKTISTSSGYICDDYNVASIDERAVLITPFGKCSIPPPMCAYKFYNIEPVYSVVMSQTDNLFIVYHGSTLLTLFKKGTAYGGTSISKDEQWESKFKSYHYVGEAVIRPIFPAPDVNLSNFTFMKNKTLFFIHFTQQPPGKCAYLLSSVQVPENMTDNVLKPEKIAEFQENPVNMCSNSSGEILALQLEDRTVSLNSYDRLMESIAEEVSLKKVLLRQFIFPEICPHMAVITLEGKDYVLGLSKRNNLYINENIAFNKCTSFYIRCDFLLITTSDHSLKCYSYADVLNSVNNKSLLSMEVMSQTIERGATIVISPSNSTKVILQMPRGNLETVHPRALVLSAICKHLDELQFLQAFQLAKVHRIDLNILCDYNFEKFSSSVTEVIRQISSPSDLNLFLASLKNEDICQTMYSLAFPGRNANGMSFANDKINTICNHFRGELDENNDYKYYQTLMATYAKKTPPELDLALVRLKSLKDTNNNKHVMDVVEKALNFLLYLVDVNQLIDVAIGTYDLEIAVMVSQKSQRDPKEFLPFYNELQNMEENYRNYKIDMHLRRYKKALLHISKCDNHFDEFISLMKEQRLYTDSLNLFHQSSDKYKSVWKVYGSYLMEKRFFDEAGLAFTRCGEDQSALQAYKEATNWQMMLCAAGKLDYSNEKIVSLCSEVVEKLKNDQKYLDAAYLLEHYIKDTEESIVTLIEGCEWSSALLLISRYKRQDISDTHLKPALVDHYTYLNSHIDQISTDFQKHLDRLQFLRSEKSKKEMLNLQEDNVKCVDEELFSDAGSVTDIASSIASSKQISGSIVTRKSSKSRRKQKLKKYRLKEGSPDEDLAHIAALSEIVAKVDVLKDNFFSTLKTMVLFGFDEKAVVLQRDMCSLVDKIGLEIPNIWNPALTVAPSTSDMQFGPESTTNSIVQSLQNPQSKGVIQRRDPELSEPTWRNIDISLQMFK